MPTDGAALSPYADRPWRSLWSVGVGDLDPDQPLMLEGLASQAQSRPSAPAIHYFGRTLSWSDLDGLSSGFAHTLLERSLSGARVALYMQNMPTFVIATLGAWKAGCAVVPINPMLKRDEVEFILRDSQASVLVALSELLTGDIRGVAEACDVRLVAASSARDLSGDDRLADLLPAAGGVEHDSESFLGLCEGVTSRRLPDVTPADAAFITYTSGTTGRPKGAVNTHANVAFNSAAKAAWFDLGATDVILGIAPLFHITGLVAHIALSVTAGAPLVLGFRFGPQTILRLIEEYRPTFAMRSSENNP